VRVGEREDADIPNRPASDQVEQRLRSLEHLIASIPGGGSTHDFMPPPTTSLSTLELNQIRSAAKPPIDNRTDGIDTELSPDFSWLSDFDLVGDYGGTEAVQLPEVLQTGTGFGGFGTSHMNGVASPKSEQAPNEDGEWMSYMGAFASPGDGGIQGGINQETQDRQGAVSRQDLLYRLESV
jgi:hypothetical protein